MPSGWVPKCVRVRSAFCVCVCGYARRPADSGTSAECLPFPQSFDVTRSCCDNEPCAPPQGEHPAVCPRLCQSSGPTPTTPPTYTVAHTHSANTAVEEPTATRRRSASTRCSDSVNMTTSFMWHRNVSSPKSTPALVCTVHTTSGPGNVAEHADQYQDFFQESDVL